jgi:hypothetical protein
MLSNYIENLQSSIQWAQYQDDIDILCLAKEQMDQLVTFVTTLPAAAQQVAYRDIDRVLPMEWPLWMEACRYEDSQPVNAQAVVFH